MITPFSKLKPADKFAFKWTAIAEDGGEMQGAHPVCKQFTGCEYEFCENRRWRLDFAWPELKVGVEIDGFGYGHQAQQHMAADNEKQNEAVELGWTILRFNSRQLGSHGATEEAVRQVCRVLLKQFDG